MVYLHINPNYRQFLEQHGLADMDQILALPALIVSGHPDRQVSKLTLGNGTKHCQAILKREHRIPFKERLANLWAGYGPISKSGREFQLLLALRAHDIGCPEPIAVGEDNKGRAFLLVKEIAGTLDLRLYLDEYLRNRPALRRQFARRLGQALAKVHDAGFDHPDLYAKHVLVDPRSGKIHFLDWQRSRHRKHVAWMERWRDLAALNATVGDYLVSAGDRLACLRAYLKATLPITVPFAFRLKSIKTILSKTRRLRRKRRIREQCLTPLACGSQNLIWLDGEALCVTREFQQEMNGHFPAWLRLQNSMPNADNQSREETVDLPNYRTANFVKRCSSKPWDWLVAVLRRRRPVSPELAHAGVLFRLQRFGVRTIRLLAVGQRQFRPWQSASFLLTEKPSSAIPLSSWLAEQQGVTLWTAELKLRRQLLKEAGQVLRRIHNAGYHGNAWSACHFLIQPAAVLDADELPRAAIIIGCLDGLVSQTHSRSRQTRKDMLALLTLFRPFVSSRTDWWRCLKGYLGADSGRHQTRRLLKKLLQSNATPQRAGGHAFLDPIDQTRFEHQGAA